MPQAGSNQTTICFPLPWLYEMCQSVSTHMRVVSCRGLEASVVVGLALVLIVANFLSPSWPSSIRLSSAWRGRTSQLHAMATDYTPAVVVYVTVPNKETGNSFGFLKGPYFQRLMIALQFYNNLIVEFSLQAVYIFCYSFCFTLLEV